MTLQTFANSMSTEGLDEKQKELLSQQQEQSMSELKGKVRSAGEMINRFVELLLTHDLKAFETSALELTGPSEASVRGARPSDRVLNGYPGSALPY